MRIACLPGRVDNIINCSKIVILLRELFLERKVRLQVRIAIFICLQYYTFSLRL